MITKLSKSKGNVLGVKISGKVSLEMEKEWINEFEKLIAEYDKISTLVFLDDHARWGLKAGIEDIKWLCTHMKNIEKIAVVADSNFWKWYVALDKPFGKLVGIGEKYFKPENIDDAWNWLNE